jgi:hypothetical protein
MGMPRSSEVVQPVPSSTEEDLSAERVRRQESARRAANAVSSVAWIPQGDLAEAEWLATGRRLGSIGRGSQWWLGDWVRHGADRWGDRFTEASRATGYDRSTLRTIAWIASRIDSSRRNENLTWDHHVQVASLDPAEQEYWLKRSEEERLTVADLKLELRTRRQGKQGERTAKGADDAPDGGGTACPNCGHHPAAG